MGVLNEFYLPNAPTLDTWGQHQGLPSSGPSFGEESVWGKQEREYCVDFLEGCRGLAKHAPDKGKTLLQEWSGQRSSPWVHRVAVGTKGHEPGSPWSHVCVTT